MLFSLQLFLMMSNVLFHVLFVIDFQVEPIFEKGVDQPSMDEARILLVRILDHLLDSVL